MQFGAVVEQACGQEEIGPLDCQWVVGHEFHVSQGDSGPECHVHAQSNNT